MAHGHNRHDNNEIVNAMSSVLLKKKSVDFLAPSKAIQDAREKLGPIYFDAKLLECPQNAVELSKLIQEYDDIDRQRFKVLEETRRCERMLIYSLQSMNKSSRIPDSRDIKLPPPGFRFRANGDPKLGLKTPDQKLRAKLESRLKICSSDNDLILMKTHIDPGKSTKSNINTRYVQDEDNETIETNIVSVKSDNNEDAMVVEEEDNSMKKFVDGECRVTISSHQCKTTDINTFEVDYEKEISDLEKIIKEINEDLEKNNIDLNEYSGAKGKVYDFLRAHARGEKLSFKKFVEPLEFSKPNDRFAIQPGSSTFIQSDSDLHKRHMKTRSHGCCVACQLKLKHSDNAYVQMKKDLNTTTYQKWHYAPQGKRVDSNAKSCISLVGLRSSSSIGCRSKRSLDTLKNKSSSQKMLDEVAETSSKSTIQGKDMCGAKSKPGLKRATNMRTRSAYSQKVSFEQFENSEGTTSKSLHRLRSAVLSPFKSSTSSLSNGSRPSPTSFQRFRSATSASQYTSLLHNHQLSIVFLKKLAAEEGRECDKKVREFISKIDQAAPKTPPRKYAFL